MKQRHFALVAILALAAFLRLQGIRFGLWPLLSHTTPLSPLARPDEELMWGIALQFFSGDLNPHFFWYPSLHFYALGGIYAIYFVLKWIWIFNGSLPELNRALVYNPGDLILLSRLFSVFLGVLNIALVDRIASKVFGKRVGILSAFFFACAYLHVRDSHFGVPTISLTLMMSLAFWSILKVLDRGQFKDSFWAGLLSGLAISTKYNALSLLAPLLFAQARSKNPLGHSSRLLHCFFWIAVGFFLGTPYALLSVQEFISDLGTQSNMQSFSSWRGVNLGIGWIYHLFFTFPYGLGLSFFTAAIAGLFFALRKKYQPFGHAFFLWFLSYYLLFGAGQLVFTRYMVPLIPCLAIFAALAIEELIQYIIPKVSWVAYPVALLCALPSLISVIHFNHLLKKPDSRLVAAEWINSNVPKDAKLLLMSSEYADPAIWLKGKHAYLFFDWPLPFLKKYSAESPDYYRFFARLEPRASPLAKGKMLSKAYDYVIVAQSPLGAYTYTEEDFLESKKRYSLVAKIQGVGNNPKMKFDLQDAFFVPFQGSESALRPGPNYFIYRKIVT